MIDKSLKVTYAWGRGNLVLLIITLFKKCISITDISNKPYQYRNTVETNNAPLEVSDTVSLIVYNTLINGGDYEIFVANIYAYHEYHGHCVDAGRRLQLSGTTFVLFSLSNMYCVNKLCFNELTMIRIIKIRYDMCSNLWKIYSLKKWGYGVLKKKKKKKINVFVQPVLFCANIYECALYNSTFSMERALTYTHT